MTDPLIPLTEAAKYLDFTPSGLRKIIDRSRRATEGETVNGETIRYFQTIERGPIKFKKIWLDDFIDRCAKGGENPKPEPPAPPRPNGKHWAA